MPIKVLVSGAAGDVGQGVLKALAASPLDIEPYTTCIGPHSSWLHMGAQSFIAPLSASEDYVPYLIRLIQRHGIQVFFPTVDGEITKIAREKARIEGETGAQVFVAGVDKVAVSDDKFNTAEFLRANGFAYPASAVADGPEARALADRLGYPLIVKKRSGKGSQDVFRVDDEAELERRLDDPTYVVQEWLDPDQGEYTSGLYLGDDGEIKGVCTFRRSLRGGSTYIAERIVDPVLEQQLERIARALGMKYLNIQSMRRGDELVPFEFNGRLSGTTAMVSRVFNAPEMFIRERILGEHIARVDNPVRFVAMRYYEEAYATPEQIDALLARSAEI
ncbi:MAG: ATP-grasp domain-containing protein [Gammaproteobacteria bacterium]|nr:ATP-grasp domain-containing protein [Gammaproteobacteria bacterium]